MNSKFKKFSLLSVTLIISCIMLCMITNADENTNSFYIKGVSGGASITQNGQTASVAASPGSDLSFVLGVNTNKCLTSSDGIPWRLNDVTLGERATSPMNMIVYQNNGSPTNKITFVSTEPACGSSGVDIATFNIKIPDDFSENSTASVVISDAKIYTLDSATSTGQVAEVDFNGVTLNITYKAPTIDDKFTIQETTSSSVTISISKVNGTTCSLLRSNTETGTYDIIKQSINCAGETYQDLNVSSNTTYYYKLKVDDKYSAPKSAKTKESSESGTGEGASSGSETGSNTGSGSESTNKSNSGDVSGDTDTGAMTPIMVIGLCGLAFIVIRRYNKDNKLFNRI